MGALHRVNSVLFTIMSIAVIIFTVGIMIFLIYTLTSREPTYHESDELMSQEEIDKLIEQGKPAQVISFRGLIPIRGTDHLFLVAVAQTDLDKPQRIPAQYRSSEPRVQVYPPHTALSSSYSFYRGYKILNNLLLYSWLDNTAVPVFTKRVYITDFINYFVDDKNYTYIVACDNDSNEDGKINDQDLQDIYIYEAFKRSLKRISTKSEFILSSERLGASDIILVEIGVDRNDDKEFEFKFEPISYKVFNAVSHEYKDFVDEKAQQVLQDILVGRGVE